MGRDEGLSERDVLDLADHRKSDAYSEVEKLALDYALCLCETPAEVPGELFEALRKHFDEGEMIELTATAAWENYLARFNRGFAVEAEGFSGNAVCPIPDHLRRGSASAAD